MHLASKSPLWRWLDVANWLYENNIVNDPNIIENANVIEIINSALASRNDQTKKQRKSVLKKLTRNKAA